MRQRVGHHPLDPVETGRREAIKRGIVCAGGSTPSPIHGSPRSAMTFARPIGSPPSVPPLVSQPSASTRRPDDQHPGPQTHRSDLARQARARRTARVRAHPTRHLYPHRQLQRRHRRGDECRHRRNAHRGGFRRPSRGTRATTANSTWRWTTSTPYSESAVRWVAERTGSEGDLGRKGRCGILRNAASSQAFLSDPEHPLGFHFIPKHASWLNQIEIWLSSSSVAATSNPRATYQDTPPTV